MSIPRMRRAAVGLAILAAAAMSGAVATPSQAESIGSATDATSSVNLKLLAINDLHGNLEPPGGSSGRLQKPDVNGAPVNVNAGGTEYLATHLQALRAEAAAEGASSLTVAAGDLIGASPLLSAAFHDEPTIEALNLMGLDYASVGNHEFDEGSAELLRIQNGGCHPADGCQDGTPYKGAKFQYLSANAFVTATGKPLLPPYAIRKVGGVKVGFIGMTLEGTKLIVSQEGVAGLDFADEAETANHYAAELRAQGVETIIVLLHEGGAQSGPNAWQVNGCNGFDGPVVDIVKRMDDSIDAVVSGHTHQAYNCVINDKLVTSASSFGRLVTDIDLKIDRNTGDVTTAQANNVIVERNVATNQAQTDLVARYRRALGPIASQVVGETTETISNTQEALFGSFRGESPMGNLIADAQLAVTDNEQGAVAAFMNPGGVRAGLDVGQVTYEEAFTVQPFANNLVTLDLTGAQLYCLLEQQFTETATRRPATLQPSATVSYVVDANGTTGPADNPCAGTRVVRGSLTIGGTAVADTTTYRVTVNNFLAGGGDGFNVLTGGTNAVTGMIDLDALTAYLGANSPVSAPALDRIRTTTEVG